MACHYCGGYDKNTTYPLINSDWTVNLVNICCNCYNLRRVNDCSGCGISIYIEKYTKIIDGSIVSTCSAECADKFTTKKRRFFN